MPEPHEPGSPYPAQPLIDAGRFVAYLTSWRAGVAYSHKFSFQGAIRTLVGASLETVIVPHPERWLSPRAWVGRIETRSAAVRPEGWVSPVSQDEVVQSEFLGDIGVTLVVRARGDRGLADFGYQRPCMAIHYGASPPELRRRLSALELLSALDRDRFAADFADFLAVADEEETCQAMTLIDVPLHAYGLVDDMLARLGARHGALVEPLRAVLEHGVHVATTRVMQARLGAARLRGFLKILAACLDRRAVLDGVRAWLGTEAPAEAALALLGELDRTPHPTLPALPNTLGVALGEDGLLIARCLLEDEPPPRILARLREEFDEEEVDARADELLALAEALRHHLVLRPLFTR